MKCTHCKDTRKYKQPNNKERFEKLIDIEMEKSYFVNYDMAEEKAYKEVGFTIIDCPFCNYFYIYILHPVVSYFNTAKGIVQNKRVKVHNKSLAFLTFFWCMIKY